jgi:hypothetical protein
MQHYPGLAASPRVRGILIMESYVNSPLRRCSPWSNNLSARAGLRSTQPISNICNCLESDYVLRVASAIEYPDCDRQDG